jgi:imidazolonepropionase
MSDIILLNNIQSLSCILDHKVRVKKGVDMGECETIHNAWLLIADGKISDFGTGNPPAEIIPAGSEIVDCTGKTVIPAFCDSHTHLVYAGSREIEYIDKIKGLSYEEIAKRGGGILNSATRLHETSEEKLTMDALERLNEISLYGTGAVEIKSGYGLNTSDELKMLRVIRNLKALSPVTIKSTFLGAHAVPSEYKGRQEEYVDLVVNEMIPAVGEEKLADFIDVFCDKGFFTPEQTGRILEAGISFGMRPKIHANELDYSGGIQTGVKYNALSVDHLEYTGDDEIEALKNSDTVATILPGAAFFLNMVHAPARRMINSGVAVALASDFNPGSSPSGNMQLILSMGCITFRMLPDEALNACTINGAHAMGISNDLGSITKGKVANLIITKPIPSLEFMPYYYGSNKADTVILNGKIIHRNISF